MSRWESVGAHLERREAPGGWIYRTASSDNLTFVPMPDKQKHEAWKGACEELRDLVLAMGSHTPPQVVKALRLLTEVIRD